MAQVNDIGIDLGTSNVLIYMKGKGIVLREPAVVAIERESKKVLAVGSDAYRMIGRTPNNVLAVRPLRQGTVADFELTSTMLRYFVGNVVGRRMFSRPRAVISVPSGVNEVEKRSIISIMFDAGMRRTQLLDRPIAAALGVGLQFQEAYGTMIVDMGAGVTDIAVLSMGEVVVSSCVPVGGDYFDAAIIRYLRKNHNLLIGERTAEEIKVTIGCVAPRPEEVSMVVKGRDLRTGLPRETVVTSTELVETMRRPAWRIVDEVLSVLELASPELVSDVAQNGIVLTGGGSQIWGMDKLITERTEISCVVADDPECCVALGCGKSLQWISSMQEGTINIARKKLLKD